LFPERKREFSGVAGFTSAQRGNNMNVNVNKIALFTGAVLMGSMAISSCQAQCLGYQPSTSDRGKAPSTSESFRAPIVRISEPSNAPATPAIVGLWHVKFVSEGSQGIPDGTEVDAGYSEWHSDGTEIMNSGGKSPITSNFCLGVWQQTAASTFALNHFATSWDPTGSTLIGPGNIQEKVTLGPNGNSFAGTFIINQYNEALVLQQSVQGTITGTRITVTTPPSSIF
jgi:hypothetical protein